MAQACRPEGTISKAVTFSYSDLFGLLFCIQILQNLFRQGFLDFDVPGNRFHHTVFRIDPKGMRRAFPLQVTTSDSQFTFEVPALHPTNTFS